MRQTLALAAVLSPVLSPKYPGGHCATQVRVVASLNLPPEHMETHSPDLVVLFSAKKEVGHLERHSPVLWAKVPAEQFLTHVFVT
jgi:hypothetical protein